jgi:hypothetical protein
MDLIEQRPIFEIDDFVVFKGVFHFTESIFNASKLVNLLSDGFIVFVVVIFLCDFRVVGLFQEDQLGFQIGLMLIIDNGAWILGEISGKEGFAVGSNIDKGIGLGELLFNFIDTLFF